MGIEVTDEEIDKRLEELKKQYFKGDDDKYQEELEKQGLTEEQLARTDQGAAPPDKIFER